MNWARAHKALLLGTLLGAAACGGEDPASTTGSGGDGGTGGDAPTTSVGGSGAGGSEVGGMGGEGGTGGGGTGGDATGGMGGMGDGGQGGSVPMICQPGETQACYEGPNGTEGVGVCTGGTMTCSPDGTAWSGCVGQVLPSPEICSALGDEDCDGTACSETVWSEVFAGDADVSITDVAIDLNGDAVVVADFDSTVTVGAQTFTNTSTNPRMVVFKMSPAGAVLWATAIIGHAERGQLAIGAQQSIILAGTYTGNIDFGAGPNGVVTGPANNAQDVFVARLDSSGVHQWSRHLAWHAADGGIDPTGTRYAQAVELGINGDIYLGGNYTGHWGGICFPNCPSSASGTGAWLRKLNFAGSDQWIKHFDSPGTQALVSLDAGTAGVVAGGFFTNEIEIGGQTFTNGFPSGGDGWLTRFDTQGNVTWTQTLGGASHQAVWAIHLTSSRILVGGTFAGGNPFGLGPAIGIADAFVAELDLNGSAQWANHHSGDSQTVFTSLQILEEPGTDEVYLAGGLDGKATIAGVSYDTGTTLTAFVAKYAAAGTPQWSRILSTVGVGSYVSGSAIGPDARVLLVGGFNGDIDLGDQMAMSLSQYDGFAAKLEP